MMRRRIVWISDVPPAITGAGGQVGLYGNAVALRSSGHECEFIVAGRSPHQAAPVDFPVRYVGSEAGVGQAAEQLTVLLRETRPDIVWVFHTPAWPVFAPSCSEYPHVLLSGDPEWEIARMRQRVRAAPRGLPRRLVSRVRHEREVRALRRKETDALTQANERGLVGGFSRRDIVLMKRRTGVEVAWCPLAFPGWGRRPPPTPNGVPPKALLLGNMSSVATRYGLRAFFDSIWPVWRDHERQPRSTVRIVGGGRLPEGFPVPPAHPALEWVGFVPSLEDEWAHAVAMLVPVPSELGFRTRIVESWARGVPVIAHPSAEANLPMMRKNENYVAATSPEDWVDAMRTLESDPARCESLAESGSQTYEQWFTPDAAADRFSELTERALRRWDAS